MDECIIKTLAYFDIFDYPLTFSEIKKYLCCKFDATDDEIYDVISLVPVIQESDGYYYLLGRSKIAQTRTERNSSSIPKHAKAQVIAKILSLIPTIEYIGISGSVAMNNATISDDIDLFFITRKNSLWLTRCIVSLVLSALKQKRSRKSRNFRDKICPNMFMSKDNLAFGMKRRTLYTAHEIVHLQTVFDRNDTYDHLMQKNKWIKNFFPNIKFAFSQKGQHGFVQQLVDRAIIPVERIIYFIQLFHMNKHKTGETISNRNAFFHPIDRQKIILDIYKIKAERYTNLYIDNICVDPVEARFYMEEKKIRTLN